VTRIGCTVLHPHVEPYHEEVAQDAELPMLTEQLDHGFAIYYYFLPARDKCTVAFFGAQLLERLRVTTTFVRLVSLVR